jgi:hypothetical protein
MRVEHDRYAVSSCSISKLIVLIELLPAKVDRCLKVASRLVLVLPLQVFKLSY